jgi:hypothetical protein
MQQPDMPGCLLQREEEVFDDDDDSFACELGYDCMLYEVKVIRILGRLVDIIPLPS